MTNERAVSPVVAVALLIGISVLLATAIGLVLFDGGLGEAEAPEVTLSFEVDDGDVVLRHEGGESLDPAEIVVRDESGDELEPGLGSELSAGDSEVIVDPDEMTDVNDLEDIEEVTVVWEHPNSGAGSILGRFKI